MHAVSQGALGIQSRSNDFLVIQMINQLNHEETLLRCIAERTLLAQLEGGCNAPVGVVSKVTENSIVLEVVVLSICSTQKIYDKFEMKFDGLMEFECPIISIMNDEILSKKNENKNCEASDLEKLDTERPILKTKNFSYIVDLNIAQNKMLKAELCGFHLAQKLKDKGADLIIKECKVKLINND
jgi:porphobilinogen deaminase